VLSGKVHLLAVSSSAASGHGSVTSSASIPGVISLARHRRKSPAGGAGRVGQSHSRNHLRPVRGAKDFSDMPDRTGPADPTDPTGASQSHCWRAPAFRFCPG
jgi:hypothetical protein